MLNKEHGPEEKMVMKLLDMYGTLYEQQIINYISNKSPETVKKIINKLVTQHEIYRCGIANTELTRNPSLQGVQITNNKKCQKAFWILLDFIKTGKVNDNDHMQTSAPSQIFFFRRPDSYIYEIVNIDDGDETIVPVMLKNNGKIKPEIKLIVVIEDPSQMDKITQYIPNAFAFAMVDTKLYKNENNQTVVSAKVRIMANKKK